MSPWRTPTRAPKNAENTPWQHREGSKRACRCVAFNARERIAPSKGSCEARADHRKEPDGGSRRATGELRGGLARVPR
eukprot:9063427-Pyramimonas_sp.AAC.1